MSPCCKEAVAQAADAIADELLAVFAIYHTEEGGVPMLDIVAGKLEVTQAIRRAIRSQPPLSPTTPEPERLTKLEAFVAAFAARRKCDDEPDKCGFGSGPYCSQHGDPYIEDAIDAARALVATHGPGNP